MRDEYSLRMVDRRALRKAFGQKRDEVTGEYVTRSISVFRKVKSRRVRQAGCVIRVGERRGA